MEVVVADLSISSEVDRLIDVAGDIDILVNNAGYGLYGKMMQQDSRPDAGHHRCEYSCSDLIGTSLCFVNAK